MTVRRWRRWLRDQRGIETARQACSDAQKKLDQASDLAARAEQLIENNGFAEAIERTMRRRWAQ
ncbi:hypothetical protein ABG82_06330 [Mycobacteroides immunogenum]|nr:hypothetical protein ABG82_06330 [Mycobacteroides immunogenum]KPG29893.1 hypothetical protein AN913_09880 [Mycobacteroides immunogenum]KPG34910.1 hypothetical protein AN912_09725 [Mycobacteroides immunogenum]KPG43374.1 hypothetical protein AN915_17550 [Mycobacteroides immunogenum]KPG48989.1 hypothetical protein AN917_19295 [Mycobacteroides immunogenum]